MLQLWGDVMLLGLFLVMTIGCILILFSRIKIFCSITLDEKVQTLYLAVYFYRARLLERSVNLLEEADQEQSLQEALSLWHQLSQNFIQRLKDFHDMTTLVLERLRFHSISWQTNVGTGKAHSTGIVIGGIWSAKGTVLGLLAAKSQFYCKPSIDVSPLFNQKQFKSRFDCMISIRIGQSIYAILKIIRKLPAKREAVI